MNYNEQLAWKEIQRTLPEEYHFTEKFSPSEEWWGWKGHKIHLDCFRNPDAKVKVIMLHGVGTNGRQMSMILGSPLSKDGYETIAIDMPTYGLTQVDQGVTVTYDDWIQLGSDYVDYELAKDNRPVFLYGLSAGGMETYDVACKNGKVKGCIGMTFLDQQSKEVRNTTARNWFMGHIAVPMLGFSVKLGLGNVKMKMSMASKMWALCNNPQTMKAFMEDKTSAGNSCTFAFLNSYMHHKVLCRPEDFNVCPILLTQPEKDKWTPLKLSKPFLDRVRNVSVKIVILPDGGHYPVEPTALKAMHKTIIAFIQEMEG
jgi:alpha-beta hydrolase superfamily lysophospholipase